MRLLPVVKAEHCGRAAQISYAVLPDAFAGEPITIRGAAHGDHRNGHFVAVGAEIYLRVRILTAVLAISTDWCGWRETLCTSIPH